MILFALQPHSDLMRNHNYYTSAQRKSQEISRNADKISFYMIYAAEREKVTRKRKNFERAVNESRHAQIINLV